MMGEACTLVLFICNTAAAGEMMANLDITAFLNDVQLSNITVHV